MSIIGRSTFYGLSYNVTLQGLTRHLKSKGTSFQDREFPEGLHYGVVVVAKTYPQVEIPIKAT